MKRKLLKKSFSYLGIATLIISILSSTGCSKTSSDSNQMQQGNTSTTPEAVTLPITKKPITLTYWSDLGKATGAVKTMNDNLAVQELEKRTGITLKYQHPATGAVADQFNLMVASGQLPDLIEYGWATVPGGPAEYIKNKIILPLNNQIQQYAPDLQKVYQQIPTLKKESEMDDGTLYCMPACYGDLDLARSSGPVIRGDWFKTLNMQTPTTIDEWTTMLKAVKEKYPDAYPLYFSSKTDMDGTPLFIGAYGITTGFTVENGKVVYGPADPRYKDFLQQMNTWYKEGLLDPETLSGTAKIKDEKFTTNKLFAIVGSMGDNITRYTAMMRPKNPDFVMNALPYPTLKKGDEVKIVQESYAYNGGVAISTACKNVKEAVKFLDYFYTDEGHMLTNWGIEGKTYKMVDGKPQYTDLILKNPDGLSRTQAMGKYVMWQGSIPTVKYKDVLNQRDSLPEQINGRPLWLSPKNSIMIPPVSPTKEESTEIAGIMSDITTYTQEMFNSFISGKTPISGFDKYISTLKGMNIDRAIEITQQEYDRYNKRP